MLRLVCAVSMLVWATACGEGDELDEPFDSDATYGDAGTPEGDGGSNVVGDASVSSGNPDHDATTVTRDGGANVDANVNDASVIEGDASVPTKPVTPCTMKTWYRDADGDGYGDPANSISACVAPARQGWGPDKGDCYDGNADAHPGAEAWQDVDRGDGSFDYNCDGVETPQDTNVSKCAEFTTNDYTCPPPSNEYPKRPGDRINCYDEIIDRVETAGREGWWGSVAKCGTISKYGVSMTYSRDVATGYTCSEPSGGGHLQICR